MTIKLFCNAIIKFVLGIILVGLLLFLVSACGNSAISQRLVAYGSFVCSYVCRRYCDDVQKPPIIK